MFHETPVTDSMIEDGNAFLADGDVPSALMVADQCVRMDPNRAAAWALMGASRFQWREMDEALEAYGKAIRLDPRIHRPYFMRGKIFMATSRLKEAAEDFKRALEIEADHALYLSALAECYQRMDNSGSAVALLEQCVELEPDNVQSQYNLVDLYLKLATTDWKWHQGERVAISYEQVQTAKHYLKKAVRLQVQDPVRLEEIQELQAAIKANERRKFYAKKPPGIAAIVLGFLFLPTGLFGYALLAGGVLYFFALRPPQYDLNRRELYPEETTKFDDWMQRLYYSPSNPNAGVPARLLAALIPILAVPVMAVWALFENYEVFDYSRLEAVRLQDFVQERLLDDPVVARIRA
jgi:tetratricopeptide (TPR) repeat protein